MKLRLVALILAVLSVAGCERKTATDLRIFHAAGLTTVLEGMRDACKTAGIALQLEGSGSQVACRKLNDLRRPCDVIILADNDLVVPMLNDTCSWRLDFANDSIVLAVGSRAPDTAAAEEDWVPVLLRENIRLGRSNEATSPIGYRTLLVWQLQGIRSSDSTLADRLIAKTAKVVDDVERLTPLLREGELDYAFVYRSTCIAHDIRYIELAPEINLGDSAQDYSAAEVRPEVMGKSGKPVKGAPITLTLSIPDNEADTAHARQFIEMLLGEQSGLLERNGYVPLSQPQFYGPREKFAPFEKIAVYAGDLK